MKGSDCVLLFICLCIIWISLPSSSNLSIIQKWKIPFDTSVFRNSHFPEEYEKIPLPIVTDVNEDGQNDIIFLTTEYEIKIASSGDIYELGEEIADSNTVAFSNIKLFSGKDSHLQIKIPELTSTYESSLLPEFGITYGRHPVAVASGYIDPPSLVKRHQVIIVLTENWTVMCFDSKLNLLWESNPVENSDPSLFHTEASILIDPTPLSNGDRGVIIVGGRKDYITQKSEKVSHEHFDKDDFKASAEQIQKLKEEPIRGEEKLRKRKLASVEEETNEKRDAKEEQNHFSYYAFEGHTGELRWKHEPGDFEDLGDNASNLQQVLDLFSQPASSAESPDMALQLHLFHNIRHLGERDWSFFYDDIQDQLPFLWRTREDTEMISAHFDRERSFGNPRKNIDDDEDERLNKKNVIVSKSTHGIEVLHLYTGRPLTALKLNPESLYLDINNDGVIDKIQSVPEKQKQKKKKKRKNDKDSCLAVASSGIPTSELLFETSVCSSNYRFNLGMNVRNKNNDDNIDMANPSYIKNEYGLYNIVFLVSSGKISSLNADGEIIWQVDTQATWNKVTQGKKKQSKSARYGKVDSFLEMGGFPSIQPYSLYDSTRFIAAVGYHTLSIISNSGNIAAETRLPSVVNGPIIIGDWDSDGDNDIIVPCINGFIGLRVTKGSGTPLYSIVFGIIIIALPILYFLNKPTKQNIKQKQKNDPFM